MKMEAITYIVASLLVVISVVGKLLGIVWSVSVSVSAQLLWWIYIK